MPEKISIMIKSSLSSEAAKIASGFVKAQKYLAEGKWNGKTGTG
jgi:hypothetical protein